MRLASEGSTTAAHATRCCRFESSSSRMGTPDQRGRGHHGNRCAHVRCRRLPGPASKALGYLGQLGGEWLKSFAAARRRWPRRSPRRGSTACAPRRSPTQIYICYAAQTRHREAPSRFSSARHCPIHAWRRFPARCDALLGTDVHQRLLLNAAGGHVHDHSRMPSHPLWGEGMQVAHR